jgi:hypothetical protein
MLLYAVGCGGFCRQLITRVLYACKPCWLSEPQLVLDVGSKLQADLQQLLVSLTPSAADTFREQHADKGAEHAAEVAGVGMPIEQQDNKDQEQRSFLSLLSCLVAILRAAAGMLAIDGLLESAAKLMISAHLQFSKQGMLTANSCHVAAQLSCLMLALWQSIAAAIIPAAAAASSGGSVGGTASSVTGSLSVVGLQAVSQTGPQSLDEGDAAGAGVCNSSSQETMLAALSWLLAAACQTMKIKLLLAEDSVAVLGSLSQAMSVLGASLLQEQAPQQLGGAAAAAAAAASTAAVLELLLGMPYEQAIGQMFADTLLARWAAVINVSSPTHNCSAMVWSTLLHIQETKTANCINSSSLLAAAAFQQQQQQR